MIRFLPLFLCFVLSISSIAKMTYGIKVGLNSTSLNLNNSTSKIGEVIGICGKYGDETWSIQMEINYSSKNTTIDNITVEPFGDYVFIYDLIVSVKYIEIPILILYDLKLSNDISFFLECGPSYSLALSDNSERNVIDRIENPPEDIEYDYVAYNDPVMPNNLWGINFGIATRLDNLMLDFRYVMYFDNLGTVDRVHPIESSFRSIYAILTYYF